MGAQARGRTRPWLTTVLACVLSVVAATSAVADGGPVLPAPGDAPSDVVAAVEGQSREVVAHSLDDAATGPAPTADCTPDRLGFGVARHLFAFTEDVEAGRATTWPVEADGTWLVPILCDRVPIGVLWVSRPAAGGPAGYSHHKWLAALGRDLVALRPDEIVVEHDTSGLVFRADRVTGSVRQIGDPASPIIDGEVPLAQALSAVAELDARLQADYRGPDDYRPVIIFFAVLLVLGLGFVVFILRAVVEVVAGHRRPGRDSVDSDTW